MPLPFLSRTGSSIEHLEARIAPATVSASLAGTTLKIVPAIAGVAADFDLAQTGPNSFRLTDTGEEPIDFTGVKRLQIDLSAADDQVDILLSTRFAGSVKITDQGGADYILLGGQGIITGDLLLNTETQGVNWIMEVEDGVKILGAFKKSGGEGHIYIAGSLGSLVVNDHYTRIDLQRGSTVAGNVKIVTETSANFGSLGSIFGSLTVLTKGESISTIHLADIVGRSVLLKHNGGAMIFGESSLQVGGDFTVIANDGARIRIEGASLKPLIAGILKLRLGGDLSQLTIYNVASIGGLRYSGGDGRDIIEADQLTVAGRAVFNVGSGNDFLSALDSNFFGNVQYAGKDGRDSVELRLAAIYGAAKFALGEGTGTFKSDGLTVLGALHVTGGTGNDTVTLQNTTIHGKLTAALRHGDNSLSATNLLVYQRVAYTGGDGADNVSFASSTLHAFIDVNAGHGNNQFELGALSNLTALTYSGGDGVDTVLITGSVENPSAGFTRGRVKLGAGNDLLRLTDTSFTLFRLDGGAGASDRYEYDSAVTALDVVSKNFEAEAEYQPAP